MSFLGFNTDDVAPWNGGGEAFLTEEGTFLVRVTDCSTQAMKNRVGSLAVITMDVIDGPHAGKIIKEYYVIKCAPLSNSPGDVEKAKQAERIGASKIRALADAAGLTSVVDGKQLAGATVTILTRLGASYNGREPRAEVLRYMRPAPPQEGGVESGGQQSLPETLIW